MKMLVTGGSRGLGQALVLHFNADSISRQSGFDITKEEDINRIVEMSLGYDVFVNNAFDGPPQEAWANFAQTNLYLKIYDRWKETNKDGMIINIGSIGSQTIVAPEPRFETYRVSKAALDHASRQGSAAFKQNLVKFRTTLIVPDRLDTELTRSRPSWTGNGVDCADIVNAVQFVLACKANTCIDQIILSCNLNYES